MIAKKLTSYEKSKALVERARAVSLELRDAPPKQPYVYFVWFTSSGPVKIGCSTDPSRRLKELQRGTRFTLRMSGVVPGGYDLERDLHRHFSHLRVIGEWFQPSVELTAFLRENQMRWDA